MCSKVKSVINVPISGLLTAGAVNKLPKQQEIGPNDSLSVIGDNRQLELMEDELADSPKDLQNGDDFGDGGESNHEHPRSHQKTDNQPQQKIAPLPQLQVAQVINSV